MKRVLLAGSVLAALAVVWFLGLQLTTPDLAKEAIATPPGPSTSTSMQKSASASRPAAAGAAARPVELERLDLAQELNAPGKSIRDDLQLVDSVFAVWQTNFLKEGNPTGENVEITAALVGKNTLNVAFIAPDHPAINRSGELCDRWGTPFFFHQQSGTKMEIVSSGPDRQRGTADDAVFEP